MSNISTEPKFNGPKTFCIYQAIVLIMSGKRVWNPFMQAEGSVYFRLDNQSGGSGFSFIVKHIKTTGHSKFDVDFFGCNFPHQGWELREDVESKQWEYKSESLTSPGIYTTPQVTQLSGGKMPPAYRRVVACSACEGSGHQEVFPPYESGSPHESEPCDHCGGSGEVNAVEGRDYPPPTPKPLTLEAVAARLELLETGGLQNLEMWLQRLDTEFVDYRKNIDAWGTRIGGGMHNAKERLDKLEEMKQALADTMERVDEISLGAIPKIKERAESSASEMKSLRQSLKNRREHIDRVIKRLDDDSGETIRRLQILQDKVNGIVVEKTEETMKAVFQHAADKMASRASALRKLHNDLDALKMAAEIARPAEPKFEELQTAELCCQTLPPLVKLPTGDWITPDTITGVNPELLRSSHNGKEKISYGVLIRLGSERVMVAAAGEGDARNLADHIAKLANEGRAE